MTRVLPRSEPAQALRVFLNDWILSVKHLGASEQGYALAEWVANTLVENASGIYRCDELELALLPTDSAFLAPSVGRVRGSTLHVLSEPYPHGGHTRVVKHLLAHAGGGQDVLLTRSPIHPEAHAWLGTSPDRVFGVDTDGCSSRVRALAAEMAAYSEVHLYLHPGDIVGAVAVRLARLWRPDMRVGFFNHADHAFSVGIGAADCVFEISTYGWQLRQARGCEGRAAFVGIPIEPPMVEVTDDAALPVGPIKAMSAGTGYKFKPVGSASLPALVDRLLSIESRLGLDLIGPSASEPWWRSVIAHHGDRVRFHGMVPHAAYLRMLRRSAFFIDSYPKTGGTAFPEALLAGGHVVGLMGGTWGFSLADVLRVPDEAAFIARCQALLHGDSDTLQQQADIRATCATFHAPGAVWQRIQVALHDGVMASPCESLTRLGNPPILAEEEWRANGRVRLRLPYRRGHYASAVHRAIAQSHSRVFGRWCLASLRWWITWFVRYGWRSA